MQEMKGTDAKAQAGATGPRPRYMDAYDEASALPVPQPDEFMEWLFNSGLLSEYDKDVIRARFAVPPSLDENNGPADAAGTITTPPTVT